MPRSRKKAAVEAVDATANNPAAHPTATTENLVEPPPFEPTGKSRTDLSPTPAEPITETRSGYEAPQPASEAEPTRERQRFRSWVVDGQVGYRRLVDQERQRLVVQFDQKPNDDVITALKGAGFIYATEYVGLRNAWVRANDYEGRLQIEAIEKLIGSTHDRSAAVSR